jgi:hypothetical protein
MAYLTGRGARRLQREFVGIEAPGYGHDELLGVNTLVRQMYSIAIQTQYMYCTFAGGVNTLVRAPPKVY